MGRSRNGTLVLESALLSGAGSCGIEFPADQEVLNHVGCQSTGSIINVGPLNQMTTIKMFPQGRMRGGHQLQPQAMMMHIPVHLRVYCCSHVEPLIVEQPRMSREVYVSPVYYVNVLDQIKSP